MAKLSKAKDRAGEVLYDRIESKKEFRKVSENRKQSYEDVVQPNLPSWDEKESMLVGTPMDSGTAQSNSSINDPRLATMTIERAARVMAQNPQGKALAMSKDDVGKNKLMNLVLDKWVLPNANSQFSFLIKSRLWDMYSLMYGVQFALVDTVVKEFYQGADYFLLPIRDCRPQAGRFSIEDSDFFGVDTWVAPEWLKARDKKTWHNIDELLLKAKTNPSKKGETNANERTFIQRQREPAVNKDKNNPMIRLYTEYRRDRWVTIAPDYEEEKLCLRDIANPHGNDELPIVAKYCFPLMDSIYGLGEFERGKTLQYALNSLINLYMDGVKMSIFPPIILDADGIVASSILQEPAAKWLQTKPNSIQVPNLNVRGLETFQGTYSFLLAAIQNQAGTTDTSTPTGVDPTYGKTPRALQLQSARENARDSWDRFMMEESLQSLMGKFVNLTATKTEKPIELTLFAAEIEDIKKTNPDVVEMFSSGERGSVTINPEQFKKTKFNYEITKGSTYKVDNEQQNQVATAMLGFAVQNWALVSTEFAKAGKKLSLVDLFQKVLATSGLQDSEKVVSDMTDEEVQQMQQAQGQGEQKPPNISINMKDLPPDGQVQAAAQAGIKLDPQQLMQAYQQRQAMEEANNNADLMNKMPMNPNEPMPTPDQGMQPMAGNNAPQFQDPQIQQMADQLASEFGQPNG